MELFILLWPVSGWVGAYFGNKALSRRYPGVSDTAGDIASYMLGTFGGPVFLLVSLPYIIGWNHDAEKQERL